MADDLTPAARPPGLGGEPVAGPRPPRRPEPAAGPPGQPPVTARQAASVILVRAGAEGSEVELLLVRRNPEARFMGGVWVFPGGAVDAGDGQGEPAQRAAAVRELAEEAGIDGVDPAELVKFSRWITPVELPIRFDTHFFLAGLPEGSQARIDGRECVAHGWFTPRAALEAHAEERILLVLPTIRQLEQLRGFTSLGALVERARARAAPTVGPGPGGWQGASCPA